MYITDAMAARRLPTKQAAELLNNGFRYLDVRTPQEFASGHVKDAINIPLMLSTPEGMNPNPDFMNAIKETFPDTKVQLVVGCKAGNRSARACTLLEQEHYNNLVDNAGGFDGWVAEKLPVG